MSSSALRTTIFALVGGLLLSLLASVELKVYAQPADTERHASTSSLESTSAPQDVRDYVDAWNRAVGFSTPEERLRLSRGETSELESRDLLRLRHVRQWMKTVYALELPVDDEALYTIDLPRIDRLLAPELLEIKEVHQLGRTRIAVDVVAFRLDPSTNRQLVAQYQPNQNRPVLDTLQFSSRTRITHFWILTDEEVWRKQPTSYRSLAPSSADATVNN